MKYLITFLLMVFTFNSIYSQDAVNYTRNCATMDVLERLLEEDPGYLDRLEKIESDIQAYIKSNPTREAVITIPVVVHVVYKTTSENISNAQIQSQITVLNNDFRKLNADANLVPAPFAPLAADCMINFCLATTDPNGNPTTGITRTKTKKRSFRTNDDVKFTSRGGINGWPSNKYLNIWVCNLSNGILGYAQFPGGNAATDGVVVLYRAFGTVGTLSYPFDKGRTATHEVGHWLNLRHIWGDDGGSCSGSDLVNDTPNQGAQNYGCPSWPKVSCNNGPDGDMWMNYMDYTDDRCMYMFSTGQSTRMGGTLSGVRAPIVTSNGCSGGMDFIVGNPRQNINSNPSVFGLQQNYPNPFNPSTLIKFSLPVSGSVTLKIFDASGVLVEELINGSLQSGIHEVVFDGTKHSSGIYFYELNMNGLTETKKMILIK